MIPHVISPLIARNDITCTMTIQLTPFKQITKVIVKFPIKLQTHSQKCLITPCS
jgi:hypothetical protein